MMFTGFLIFKKCIGFFQFECLLQISNFKLTSDLEINFIVSFCGQSTVVEKRWQK